MKSVLLSFLTKLKAVLKTLCIKPKSESLLQDYLHTEDLLLPSSSLEPIEYKISRVSSTIKDGTFGVFMIKDAPICVTLEETWLDNIRRESCIPEGVYTVKKYSGTKYKNVWQVYGVPNRTAILIHWGNTERNTAGCILMGKYFADFGDRRGVADSRKTIEMLRKRLPDEFRLHIEDNF